MRIIRSTYTPQPRSHAPLILAGACVLFIMLYFDAIGVITVLDLITHHH